MIIKYPDGKTAEAFLLSREGNSMRVVLENGQDVAEFIDVRGTWLSENLEPVEITFEWDRRPQTEQALDESQFICAPDLAERLIRMLAIDSSEDESPVRRHLTAGQAFV